MGEAVHRTAVAQVLHQVRFYGRKEKQQEKVLCSDETKFWPWHEVLHLVETQTCSSSLENPSHNEAQWW